MVRHQRRRPADFAYPAGGSTVTCSVPIRHPATEMCPATGVAYPMRIVRAVSGNIAGNAARAVTARITSVHRSKTGAEMVGVALRDSSTDARAFTARPRPASANHFDVLQGEDDSSNGGNTIGEKRYGRPGTTNWPL